MKKNLNACFLFKERGMQIFRIMKLTMLIFIVGFLHASANSYSQNARISLDLKNADFKEVISKIQTQTEFVFFYSPEDVNEVKNLNVKVENVKLQEILDECFKNTEIEYEIKHKAIVLKKVQKGEPLKIEESVENPQKKTISGKVTDTKGEPLPGVTVIVKGTTIGITTDFDGNYSLEVPEEAEILSFSFVGMKTSEIIISGQTSINVTLEEETIGIDEVVAIGYGSQKKSDVTSAISVVDVSDLSKRPIVSAADAISGKSSGVQVSTPSGSPGGEMSVRIRGIGSPNGSDPLYVVDGVITNSIKAIDPNNIESINILKDASAAGIYGAAGSTNGVVIITTKKGSKGKPLTELRMYTGIQQVTKTIPVLNNEQYLELQEEIGGAPLDVPGYYDINNTNNNWQDLIYRNAVQNSVNLSTSGGSERGNYYMGLGYLNQEGIIIGSEFERYSVKLSTDHQVADFLKVGASINYNRTRQQSITDNTTGNFGGVVTSAITMPEYIPITYPADSPYPGLYGRSNLMSGEHAVANVLTDENSTVANNILGNAYAELILPFDIKFKSQFNTTINNSRYDYFMDPFSSLSAASIGGEATSNYSEVVRWGIDNTLSKVFNVEKHNFDLILGNAMLKEQIFSSHQHGEGFGSNVVKTLNAASTNYEIGTRKYEWSTMSYFGRLSYSYDNRYLATVTFRRDGSSRVGSNSRWGNFPAFSAGWKVSNESFMQDITFMQGLKLRAGWGKTGNLPPYTLLYPSYSLLNAGAGYPYSGGSASPGVNPGTLLGNPDLKWESAVQTNIGMDVGFINNRLRFTIDYYSKKIEDLIFTQQLPLTSGGVYQAVNLPGNNVNKGLEVTVEANIVNKNNFKWNSNFNISHNDNTMEGIDSDISFQTGAVTVAGSNTLLYTQIIKNDLPLGTFWGYKSEGVDPATGNLVYGSEPEIIGDALPDFTFGFSNDFTYKNLNLSILIDGSKGNDIYNSLRMEIESMNGFQNQSTAVLRRWQNPGDMTDVPRALGNRAENASDASLLINRISSHYIEDGSFIRMRNITLSYNIDDKLVEKIGIGGATVYFTAQNLFTITNYSGYNPEVNAYGNGTNNQASSAGESISLLSLGIDRGTYPAAKTFTLGLNIQF